jgi:CheY-like chemotaxis protein
MTGSAAERALASRRVLVVEDEYFLADDMAQVLAGLGAEVLGPVSTRDQALALLSSDERIDAAVLDINLRGQTVFPVADALTERRIPFVFSTGYGQASLPPAYQEVPLWEKPFNPFDLAKALAGLAHRPGPARPRPGATF